nr:MAG TPA: hypothetical protein [Caudoviricetes sp.]
MKKHPRMRVLFHGGQCHNMKQEKQGLGFTPVNFMI